MATHSALMDVGECAVESADESGVDDVATLDGVIVLALPLDFAGHGDEAFDGSVHKPAPPPSGGAPVARRPRATAGRESVVDSIARRRILRGRVRRVRHLPLIAIAVTRRAPKPSRALAPDANSHIEQVLAVILYPHQPRIAEAREGKRPKYGPLASTFYGVLAMTGLRYGEAGDQRWEDVDLGAGRLVLTRDKARRNDALPLTVEAVAALREWRKWSTGALVFPQRPSHNTLTMDMEACGIAGVESGVKGQWHRFRKGAVRERAKAGATIRNLKHFARHSDVNETLRNYDHAGVEELRATAELMPRLNGFLGRSRTGGIDGGKEIVDEKSVRTEVDSPGEPSTLGVSKRRKVMPTLSAKPESPAAGRAGIDSRLDTGVDVSARLATNDSGMEPGGITLPSALAADFLEAVARHLRGGA